MDRSEVAAEMLDTGRRALVGVLAGGAWLVWGLITAGALVPFAVAAFGLAVALLLGGCGYCIVKGRRSGQGKTPRRMNGGFLLVTALEGAGVAAVIFAAHKLNRLDLLPDWIGIVIGLHFLGLAKVFRAPVYYGTGAAIALWCAVAWVLFRGLTIAVCLGVAAVLWGTSSLNLLRVLAKRPAAEVRGAHD